MVEPRRSILISFDAEEFDVPREYGRAIDDATALQVGSAGLEATLDLLDRCSIAATFFTTARLAQHEPELIRRAAARHEIASHAWSHSNFAVEDLRRSRLELERISGRKVVGFRMPRMRPVDGHDLAGAGYQYDASEHPTWIPGRYNNIRRPRTPHRSAGILRIPASVTPLLRLPLFWLTFKNIPRWLYRSWALGTLRHDQAINLYFHPWELADLSGHGLPRHIRRVDGGRMAERLAWLIDALRPHGEFITFSRFAAVYRSADLSEPSA
jgi:peptidoglycan/xylan/chitin deacetylase (PgdA/CDA1 family)